MDANSIITFIIQHWGIRPNYINQHKENTNERKKEDTAVRSTVGLFCCRQDADMKRECFLIVPLYI